MDEHRRRAYLEHLGVALWQSKTPLPGALPSVLLEETFVARELEQEPITRHAITSSKSASLKVENTSPTSLLRTTLTPEFDKKPGLMADRISVQDANQPTTTSIPAFCFCKIPLRNGFLLLAELSDSTAPGLSAAEIRLLKAILLAIQTDPLHESAFDAFQVRWPPRTGREQLSSLESARDFLSAYIDAEQQRAPINGLLLLGDNLIKLNREGLITSPLQKAHIKVMGGESLRTLMAQPYSKALLWQQIYVLRT